MSESFPPASQVDLEAFLWAPDQWDQGGEIVFAVGGPPNGLDLAHARCQQSGSCVDLGALVGLQTEMEESDPTIRSDGTTRSCLE